MKRCSVKDSPQCLHGNFHIFVVRGLHPRRYWQGISAAFQVAEKLKFLSFRGTLRAEESLLLLTLEPREIPHFVRNDKIACFFRSLISRRTIRTIRGPQTVLSFA
jgi:hypothetical protein